MKSNNKMMVYAVILLIIVVFFGTKGRVMPQQTIEGDWDISQQVEDNNLQQYLVETTDFDYTDPQVYKLAQDIKSSTPSEYEAIKKTAKYVYDNVKYSSKISIQYCYDETAASVLEKGIGDCVSMSRLVTSLLRAQGIPTRTVGGCISSSFRCSAMFATYPYLDMQVTPMEEDDFKKRGFLHEWVETWTPDKGWFLIEATSGQIFSKNCQSYIFYSYDTNRYDRCVIRDQNFWNLCSVS